MSEPEWILRETVLALQEQSLAVFGGLGGIRDEGMLASALQRPVNLFTYETADLFALAASYAFGLAKNHPFIDGNKRIAFAATDVFLRVNGWRIRAKPMAIHKWMVGLLEARSFNIASIEPWLRRHAEKVD